MLDNEYINYTLITVSVIVISIFLFKLLIISREFLDIITRGSERLKPISEGVENINNIVTNNTENITNGISNISEFVGSIHNIITNIGSAFSQSRIEKREPKAIENKEIDEQVNAFIENQE